MKQITKKTLTGPGGIHLVLDRTEIFPDDPGQGTPALVFDAFWKHSASYSCACDMGELDCGEAQLTDRQIDWLFQQSEEVDRFLS